MTSEKDQLQAGSKKIPQGWSVLEGENGLN